MHEMRPTAQANAPYRRCDAYRLVSQVSYEAGRSVALDPTTGTVGRALLAVTVAGSFAYLILANCD